MGPLKNKKIKFLFYVLEPTVDEQLYQICSTLDEILQHKPIHWTPGHWSPLPMILLCLKIDFIKRFFE